MRYSILMLAIAIGCASAQTQQATNVTIGNLRRGPGIQPGEAPSWVTADYGRPYNPQPRMKLADNDSVIIRASGSPAQLNFQIGWAILDTLRYNIFNCGATSMQWNYRRADSVDVSGMPQETFIGKWHQDYSDHAVAEARLAISAPRFRRLVQNELRYIDDDIAREKARRCLTQRGLM